MPPIIGAMILAAIAAAVQICAAAAADAPIPATVVATLRDFMIQNVCLDPAGKTLPRRSPIDEAGPCPAQRDLLPGERLPYHKHDHPGAGPHPDAPHGYQRHDSFPVGTAGLGTIVEQSFDFGVGEGRRFGVFDRGSDGGDVVILSPGMASIGATEDSGGFGLWVGECRGPITATALAQSWIIAEFDPTRPGPLQGQTVARLNGLPTGHRDACPPRFNAAFTTWRVVPFRYRAGPGQGTPLNLTTLISEHYGGADRATADHVERFYFTRELGGTRWERWQNAAGNARLSADRIAAAAARFAATGRCSTPDMPGGGAAFVLVDCREWTRIEPPADPAGDAPGFFVDEIRRRADVPGLFAPPVSPR